MSDSFSVTENLAERQPNYISEKNSKIDVAKEQLISWLQKSTFDYITIIPFHTHLLHTISGYLKTDSQRIVREINNIQTGNTTMLSNALQKAFNIGIGDADVYTRYLIISDGLSHSIEQDLELVKQLPINQCIFSHH